jgi:hypothetical protein
MIRFIIPFIFLIGNPSFSQSDSSDAILLSKETILSEVVIRNKLDVISFLQRVKNDTTFYKAFRNLRILGFTSLNDIQMLDKNGKVKASLRSTTKQVRNDNCRTMQVIEEHTTGDFYDGAGYNYYTGELYASLFLTRGKVCNETNIVAGIERDVRNKRGVEKHKEQLKMLFWNPGKKIPGIPFLGDRIDIFDPDIAKHYNFSVDMDAIEGQDCYVFKIIPKENLNRSAKNKIVFDNITTWFNAKTMEIVARNYDLSYDTPLYDFDVHIEAQMTKFGEFLVPKLLRYNGNWKVIFKKRERGLFTATFVDFKKE